MLQRFRFQQTVRLLAIDNLHYFSEPTVHATTALAQWHALSFVAQDCVYVTNQGFVQSEVS